MFDAIPVLSIGLELNVSNKFIENVMSSLVHWAKYIKAPMTVNYGSSRASACSLSFLDMLTEEDHGFHAIFNGCC